MTRWIETDSNANIDISAATVIGSYTADADRLVVPQLLIDQAAGNGDYVYYAALQVNGAGSWYVIGPKTTHAAASGETAIGAQGSAVAMRSGDILRVYVDGLAGDTVTPDTVVRFFELEPVRQAVATELGRIDAATSTRLAPTDAGRTLDILATGEASANVTMWAGVAAPAAPPSKAELDAGFLAQAGADGDTLESLSDQLDLLSGGVAGSGAISWTMTIDDGTNPIDGAEVWVSTDLAGANVVAGTLSTDAMGEVTFMLDAGDYYAWVQVAGFNFTNPTAFTVA